MSFNKYMKIELSICEVDNNNQAWGIPCYIGNFNIITIVFKNVEISPRNKKKKICEGKNIFFEYFIC